MFVVWTSPVVDASGRGEEHAARSAVVTTTARPSGRSEREGSEAGERLIRGLRQGEPSSEADMRIGFMGFLLSADVESLQTPHGGSGPNVTRGRAARVTPGGSPRLTGHARDQSMCCGAFRPAGAPGWQPSPPRVAP